MNYKILENLLTNYLNLLNYFNCECEDYKCAFAVEKKKVQRALEDLKKEVARG